MSAHKSSADIVRANMRRALEESGMSVEALATATDIPDEELRTLVLNGNSSGPRMLIDDIYRVAIALDAIVYEWFLEPMDVATS